MARLLTGVMADITPSKGLAFKNRFFSILVLMSLCGLLITAAAIVLAVSGLIVFRVVFAGLLVFLLAIIALFLLAMLSRNDQDALWVFEHKVKIHALESLVQLPNDWSVQKKDPALMVVGPGGIFLIFDKADLESQNLAMSNAKLEENACLACQWVQTQVKKTNVNIEPHILIVTDYPDAAHQFDFLPYPYTMLKPFDLASYLQRLPQTFNLSELARFQVTAFEGIIDLRPVADRRSGQERRIERRPISKHAFKRTTSKLVKAVFVLMIIGGILYGAYQFRPSYFQHAWYIAKYWVGEAAPGLAKVLKLPITEYFPTKAIEGYARGVVDVYPKIGGGTVQNRFQPGEKLDILERDYDSLQEPWLYVQNSYLDGWIKQDRISFDYIKAGTSVYTESDQIIGELSILSHDIPAIAVRHRYRFGVSGSGWWEFLTPGLKRVWVKSDENPIIRLDGRN